MKKDIKMAWQEQLCQISLIKEVTRMNEYVSRGDVLDIASQYCPDDDGSCSKADVDIREMLDEIEALPTVEVQPVKHGYWKDVMMSEATGWDLSLTGGKDEVCETVCSICGDCCIYGGDGEVYLSKYCPNCGTRMDGDTE
jgi:hypothetical protein